MIRALLLGAFATTAFATCEKDLDQPACGGFTGETDFHIDNDGATNVKMTYKTLLNRAFSYVGEAPWEETAAYDGTTPAAGTPQVGTGSNQGPGWAMREVASDADQSATSIETFDLNSGLWNAPTVASGTACSDKTVEFGGTLANLVSKLDVDGRYTLYFQRVLPNPITGNNINLKWIAEQACKVKVDVEFECTGSECVEVTTIVCASFAGIDTTTNGRLSTECKVPAGFRVSSSQSDPRPAGAVADNVVDVAHSVSSTWTDNVIACNVAGAGTATSSLGGRCFFDHTTTSAITTSVQGTTTYSAYVKAATTWTALETLHVADYNLTVKSGLVKTFNMDVNVRFYSDTVDTAVTTTGIHSLQTEDSTDAFPASLAQGPFLAKSKVEMGALVNHNHAYLQVVAKVAAGSSRFKDLRVSKIVHNKVDSAGAIDTTTEEEGSDAATDATKRLAYCTVSDLPTGTETGATCHAAGSACKHHWTIDGSAYWPTAYLYCDGLMSTGIGGGAVVAGDTLVISLKWKLSKAPTAGWTSGKAQLLQEEAAEGQSVEVSLTIQLGGGETTITTAGAGGEGSADNTVTYIIIAVCVIAAALILAVVVVAFMCLRNRSQEQLVAMSPQKATVAAVYDISQPKAKADAMDV